VVEKMLVILPFEEALYRAVGVDCTYVGHPLLDHMAATRIGGACRTGTAVGLLPGSREQEIRRLLPVMIEVARGIRTRYPDVRFLTPCVDETRERQVRELAGDFPLETSVGKMYEMLEAARCCHVASGTATLETALSAVPLVILYRTSPLNYWIARRLVRVEHIGLVNILAGQGIVPEFIQADACAEKVLPVALELLEDTPRRARMLADLRRVREMLGGPGASARAAAEILKVVNRARPRAAACE
jgi:lipid-A-disaccharide synthase